MKFIYVFLACFVLMSCQEELASGPAKTPDDAANEMVALVTQSARFSAIPQQCPLAVYQSRANVSLEIADCDQNPAACLAQCEAGNSRACFRAARTIEKGSVSQRSNYTYPLFMAACARGWGNGCVNAAATVKNGSWTTERPTRAGTAQCQFQTYDRMCDDGHAWGCYMVAQEYRWGNERPQDEARYEEKMRAACQINANSGACSDRFK